MLMDFSWKYGISQIVLTIYSAGILTTNAKQTCPSDVLSAGQSCIGEFNAARQRHLSSGTEFFSGIDVEFIRTLCSDLKTSLRCLNILRDSCPASAQGDVDAVIKPYKPMAELCSRHHVIEEYAMNQNCFQIQSSKSRDCYADFLASSNGLAAQVRAGRRHSTVSKYCSHVTDLIGCIRANIKRSCSESAAQLSEQLVRSAIDLTYICDVNGEHQQVSQTETALKPGARHHQQQPPFNGTVGRVQSSFFTLALQLVLLLRILNLH